jgi:hypothetical protein
VTMIPHFSLMNVLMFATYSASVPCGDGRYLTVMLGSAAAAACMPFHADWLKDRSLIVPSSATMQPVNLAAGAAVLVLVLTAALDEVDVAVDDVVLDDGALDELLPQAAISRLAAAAAAAASNAVFFTVSSPGPDVPLPRPGGSPPT